MTETELLARARLGEEDAFSELYALHIGYVRAVARAMLRSGDVEDVCQDTFLLAFTRLEGFVGNSMFRSWITRIAINQCLMALRTRLQPTNGDSRLLTIDSEDALDRCVFSTRDAQLEGVPARLDLDVLLRVLLPLERRMLTMAYLEKVPDLEIAETLGISLSAVKNTLHRAKLRLRSVHKKK